MTADHAIGLQLLANRIFYRAEEAARLRRPDLLRIDRCRRAIEAIRDRVGPAASDHGHHLYFAANVLSGSCWSLHALCTRIVTAIDRVTP